MACRLPRDGPRAPRPPRAVARAAARPAQQGVPLRAGQGGGGALRQSARGCGAGSGGPGGRGNDRGGVSEGAGAGGGRRVRATMGHGAAARQARGAELVLACAGAAAVAGWRDPAAAPSPSCGGAHCSRHGARPRVCDQLDAPRVGGGGGHARSRPAAGGARQGPHGGGPRPGGAGQCAGRARGAGGRPVLQVGGAQRARAGRRAQHGAWSGSGRGGGLHREHPRPAPGAQRAAPAAALRERHGRGHCGAGGQGEGGGGAVAGAGRQARRSGRRAAGERGVDGGEWWERGSQGGG
mmetsp:Transcript_22229/g.71519  ORF Transcript_22229/g.71519 Transcript_22229/m.71519 type:complete len:295 (+) Transcript_22229:481-1365(+)